MLGCMLGIEEWSSTFESRLELPSECAHPVEKLSEAEAMVIEVKLLGLFENKLSLETWRQ